MDNKIFSAEVVYRKGKFLEIGTGDEFILKDNTTFKLEVSPSRIINTGADVYRPIVIIPKDQHLVFKIKDYRFILLLEEDLRLIAKEGKSKLAPVKCKVIKAFDKNGRLAFDPISDTSLNSAYTQTYSKFYDSGANNRYVFDIYRYQDELLRQYKPTWEQELFDQKNAKL